MTLDMDEAARTVVITRAFDAPAALLFQAYASCENIKRWFGPRGWPVTLCEMDFRVGGRFRFAMTGPSGQQNTPFDGEYLQIEPAAKIVYDNGFESPGAERMVVTVTFDEGADGKTLLTIKTVFASLSMHDAHVGAGIAAGINSGLDQMAEWAAEMQASG